MIVKEIEILNGEKKYFLELESSNLYDVSYNEETGDVKLIFRLNVDEEYTDSGYVSLGSYFDYENIDIELRSWVTGTIKLEQEYSNLLETFEDQGVSLEKGISIDLECEPEFDDNYDDLEAEYEYDYSCDEDIDPDDADLSTIDEDDAVERAIENAGSFEVTVKITDIVNLND